MDAKKRIIVALDVNDFGKAVELIENLSPYVGGFKVGLEFVYAVLGRIISCNDKTVRHNAEMLRLLFKETRGKLFLDVKLSDIPNTVSGAAREIAAMGIGIFNVHASAGIKAIRAAVENKGQAKVLVVTVMTSLNFAELWNVGFGRCRNRGCAVLCGCKEDSTTEREEKFVKDLVLTMAKIAKGYGADGVICSPQDLAMLKCNALDPLIKVTPGVRPVWASVSDQKRVMTPGEAVVAGADYLVIGRPITQPPAEIGEPVEAAKKIAEEIETAVQGAKK